MTPEASQRAGAGPKVALRLALVAGERSGDLLGGRVLGALRRALPDQPIHAEGVGGEAMTAEGFTSLYDIERLAVMGLVEPLGRLPELLRMRARLRERWLREPPDLFLGIDAPDFNLGLARGLRRGGVATAQLVSPTVWAWRPGRTRKVARAVRDLLCLFPFEPACYRDVDLRTHYVGHPMAGELAFDADRGAARRALGLVEDAPVIALLPGSRSAEVAQIGGDLLQAGLALKSRAAHRQLVMPAASKERFEQCRQLIDSAGATAEVRLLEGQSRDTMVAADVVILASGTATLEAMLLRRPMVIAYRIAPMSWTLMKRMAVTKYVGLPNILAGRAVVPELLQHDLTAAALALEAEGLLGAAGQAQVDALQSCREGMARDFDLEAGRCLSELLTASRATSVS